MNQDCDHRPSGTWTLNDRSKNWIVQLEDRPLLSVTTAPRIYRVVQSLLGGLEI